MKRFSIFFLALLIRYSWIGLLAFVGAWFTTKWTGYLGMEWDRTTFFLLFCLFEMRMTPQRMASR